jgi:hypothetical protein
METSTNAAVLHVTSFDGVSDADLLAGTRRLVGRSNQLLAELLGHLAEVEARGIHRLRACSSLYTYCIYELRFSEDEAFRRVAAARLARRFPALLEALASGELHLTGLLMLGPHLTEGNLVEVLERAKHRTKRELGRLVRVLDPLPAVPARIEPLGPAPARGVPGTPTWAAFVGAMNPVRELSPGDRPRDWVDGAWGAVEGTSSDEPRANGALGHGGSAAANDSRLGRTAHEGASADASHGVAREVTSAGDASAEGRARSAPPDGVARSAADGAWGDVPGIAAPASPGRVKLTPERYKVQFTATEEYVRLVEEVKALLSHAVPRVTLEEIQLRAIRALVSELRKKKLATEGRSSVRESEREAPNSEVSEARDARMAPPPQSEGPDEQGEGRREGAGARLLPRAKPSHPRQRGRYIPTVVRRAVFERDGERCTYADAEGRRCNETHRLELHHLEPFALGGAHTAANITLRCHAHNALAAEDDFGREHIATKRDSCAHEPFAPP